MSQQLGRLALAGPGEVVASPQGPQAGGFPSPVHVIPSVFALVTAWLPGVLPDLSLAGVSQLLSLMNWCQTRLCLL